MEIVDKVYEVVSVLPAEEKYGMRSQMTRSAVSIPSNIAEGSAKTSQKDYARFLEISLGSVFELETHSLVVQRRQWVEEKQMNELLELIKREQQMLQSFLKKF
ncbi:four helix bundle protein [Chryseotalea sanaruensis]|nr:four helix bundle protein [Chryseotalea sanaruensis]